MATWPATLSPPLANTFRETPPDNSLRTQMDKGPAKVRRRTTAGTRPIAFEMACDNDQLDALDTFYTDTTFSGTDEFTYTHPRTGDVVSARFTSPPSWSDMNTGQTWNVSIELEIMP